MKKQVTIGSVFSGRAKSDYAAPAAAPPSRAGKKRVLPPNKPSQRSSATSSSGLWSEKHSPATVEDLKVCIHGNTIDRIREWLDGAIPSPGGSQGYPTLPKRLLILCGKPGTGKSSAARVVAQDRGLNISEWNDTFGQVGGRRCLLPGVCRVGSRLFTQFDPAIP